MRKFKLIKEFPFEGSPKVGYISESKSSDGLHYWNTNWFYPEKYPEFWEEIVEQTPFNLHYNYIGGAITGVTRLRDNVYFSKGLRVKMPNSDSLGFIYGFSIQNNRLIIDHTFKYLMDEKGITDHLDALRPCLYTKEELL